MKLHLTFEKSDFDNLRAFEKAVERQLGGNVYVGTNSLCLYFDYPKELTAMLRPFPPSEQLEFDLESSKPDRK
jgi:hypothetical protein